MEVNKESIAAVVVTYANRWETLCKVLIRLNTFEEIGTIIVVDNNSKYRIKDKIDGINTKNNIVLQTNKVNKGSAGGFKDGIKLACKTQCENILLLDDDNEPNVNIFLNLKKNHLDLVNKKNTVISLYRKEMHEYIFEEKFDRNIQYYRNSFWGFSILNRIEKSRGKNKKINYDISRVLFSQYSGLLFPKSAVETVGLPDESYYLYVDDTDYTYRLSLAGYKIFVVKDAEIIDQDYSWAYKLGLPMYKALFYTDDFYRAAYQIRNRVIFDNRYFKTSNFMYSLNKFIWLVVMFMFIMPKNKKGIMRYSKILYSIKQGQQKQTGEDTKFLS